MFQPDPQLATMQSYYLKNTFFSSTSSAATVYYTVDYYIIQDLYIITIYLAACVFTHLSLLSLIY